MSGRMDLIEAVEALSGARVLCVGDLILDHFRRGSIERISPEAPVPVLLVDEEDTMPGGAGNVIRNLSALGAKAVLVSVVGGDGAGADVRRLLEDLAGSDAHLLTDAERRTSTKARYLADGQQVLRADRETAKPLSDALRASLLAAVADHLPDCDAVVLSDYGKGILADGVAAELVARAKAAGKTVVVDPKGRDFAPYRGADVITPNRKELAEASALPITADADVGAAASHLINAHAFAAVLVTRGADGMTLVRAGAADVHLTAQAREVFDVSGAGDTVVAAVAAAIAAGRDLEDAAALANVAAGIVVGKVGTAVAEAAEVIAQLLHQDLSGAEAKVMDHDLAARRVAEWRAQGRVVGFTNGCFDLLHPGHIALLAKAAQECDRLVVGLNSDASVTRLKGADRPIQTEAARAVVLASLAAVHMVVPFSDDTPLALIEALTPDVLVKGADWAIGDVVGADVVVAAGGRVVLVELEPGHSTTATIARLAK